MRKLAVTGAAAEEKNRAKSRLGNSQNGEPEEALGGSGSAIIKITTASAAKGEKNIRIRRGGVFLLRSVKTDTVV